MRLKEIVPKLLIIAAIGAVVWLGLGMFSDTADDNYGKGGEERSSYHDSIERL
jgi:hypothetical protein